MFSFTASKEYVPTTPTSKTDAPICVVEGTAQELLLFGLELACHDSIMIAATTATLKSLLTIVEENFSPGRLFSHKKNFCPNFLHFLESSLLAKISRDFSKGLVTLPGNQTKGTTTIRKLIARRSLA